MTKNPRYLAYIRQQPCLLADTYTCQGPIEAHHYGPRGLSQKVPDEQAIPLCVWHHREGPEAVHKLGKCWAEHHGLDVDGAMLRLRSSFDLHKATRLMIHRDVFGWAA